MSLNCTYEDILNDLVTILIQTMWKEDDSVASFVYYIEEESCIVGKNRG